MDGDFLRLLPKPALSVGTVEAMKATPLEATTVFAFHYKDGILMAGDHRATAGNQVFSDQIEKILQLDRETMMAIAGSPAVALEMARTLETSFEFYRRSQLQAMSLKAKTRALTQLLKDNIPATLQGIGTVVPILAGTDRHRDGSEPAPVLYFYDPLGAQFESTTFAASGSGSGSIQSILSYLQQWGNPSPQQMNLKEAVVLSNRLLQTAATFDTATGGIDPEDDRFATIKTLTSKGIENIDSTIQHRYWEQAGSHGKR
ncbi:MAG: proteasome subunit alpha [Verrucomicrobiota bacterium]